MLILKRRIGDTINIDPGVTVTVLGIYEDQVVLRFRRVTDPDSESYSVSSDHTLESIATQV